MRRWASFRSRSRFPKVRVSFGQASTQAGTLPSDSLSKHRVHFFTKGTGSSHS